MNKHKRISLFVFLTLETLVLGLIAAVVYQWWTDKKVKEATEKMTVLGDDTVIQPDDSGLKYYYTLKPNSVESIQPKRLPYVATYTYNADGLHERYDYDIPKPDNVYRIVALGDSFTFGQLVNTEDNWTERLEDLLNTVDVNCGEKRFEVINLGMPGFDIQYITHRYLTIGDKYDSDLIVWFESGNGLTRFTERVLPLVEECRKNTESMEVIVDPDSMNSYYKCWDKAGAEVRASFGNEEELLELLGRYLQNFFQQVSQKPVVFYAFIPNSDDDTRIATISKWTEGYRNVRFAPVITDVVGEGEGLFDGHPNARGHSIFAEEIFNDLKSEVFADICW